METAVLMPGTSALAQPGLPPPATAPPAAGAPASGLSAFAAMIAGALSARSASGTAGPDGDAPPALLVGLVLGPGGEGGPAPGVPDPGGGVEGAPDALTRALAGLLPLLRANGGATSRESNEALDNRGLDNRGLGTQLLDRFAGAEVTEDREPTGDLAGGALEMLMAQLLLTRPVEADETTRMRGLALRPPPAEGETPAQQVQAGDPGTGWREHVASTLDLLRAQLAAASTVASHVEASQPPHPVLTLAAATVSAGRAPAAPQTADRVGAVTATGVAELLDGEAGGELLRQLAAALTGDARATEDAVAPRPGATMARPPGGEQSEDASFDLTAAPARSARPGEGLAVADAPELDGQPLAAVLPATQTAAAARTDAAPPAARAADGNVFASALAETVQSAVIRGTSEVRVVLNPPELGQMDIRIVETEQGLRIRLEASQSTARELVERQLPALQQALEARELRVDRLQVTAPSSASAEQPADGRTASGQSQGGGHGDGGDGDPEWSPVAALGLAGGDDAEGGGQASAASRGAGSGSVVGHDGRVDVLA